RRAAPAHRRVEGRGSRAARWLHQRHARSHRHRLHRHHRDQGQRAPRPAPDARARAGRSLEAVLDRDADQLRPRRAKDRCRVTGGAAMTTKTNRVVIPIKDLQPHEAAARLFAVMAYPLSEVRRQTFERAICNKAIRAAAADLTWRSTTQMIRPE